jgi:hypothetical protein
MCRKVHLAALMATITWLGLPLSARGQDEPLFEKALDVQVPPITKDGSIRYDYDIVYVRAGRAGDEIHKRYYTDFSSPVTIEPGADLMLLHPDGSEELLAAGGQGSITDPVVSYDGQWVYYVHIHNLHSASQWSPPAEGADIFKIHLPTRRIVRLTNQKFSPNLGAGKWSADFRQPKGDDGAQHKLNWYDYGVYNMGPFPLPGGKIVFTSNRDGFRPAKGYPAVALQLFVMDDRDGDLPEDADPTNLEKIGHLNISGALHPVVLRDGRIMYSTLESQGLRSDILWGIWTIHPDGTNWAPLVSAFDPGGAPNGFHFQTQLSDGAIVVEEYYNQNNSGFGALIKLPPSPPDGYPPFGPAYMNDPRNKPWRYGRFENGRPKWYRKPFMPTGAVSLTPFSLGLEGPADLSDIKDKNSPKVGKFTHPSAAPDNHLLVIYSPGPVNHQYKFLPQLDGGIYLLKNGDVIDEPAQLRLIKNDPNYNECWPRAVVPYRRIAGIDEPESKPRLINDGSRSPQLPAGTPFGLVGTSSFYKRESYPNGVVPEGKVTATFSGKDNPWRGLDEFTSHGNGMQLNWHNQGADAGLYENEEIHAVRILAMEATTDRKRGEKSGRQFYSHARERLRVLGEIPVRKFAGGKQPLDPDSNPDTSFLAKIPADTAFSFQTLDKNGLVLNMAQTWHQLRPGEIRHDCGGCHAHSQQPTRFEDTAAARADYQIFDLTRKTPLITTKEHDESKQRWDADDSSGLRYEDAPAVNVEYWRDVRPILSKSCVACHSGRDGNTPAGNLDLDADGQRVKTEHEELPGTYYRLAADEKAQFGHKPISWESWGSPNASRYIRKLQSRRSLLVWKIFGRRLDGFSNDDHPSESEPGKRDLVLAGKPLDLERHRARYDVDFVGSQMPPPEAVAGTYKSPSGKTVKVEPLTDTDRRVLACWIDLGCPIDLDFDPAHPDAYGFGWTCDDQRPTLALTWPQPGVNRELSRILVGMYDYGSGLDDKSFHVTADFELGGKPTGENLAPQFAPAGEGIWEWKLPQPLTKLANGTLTVIVRDQQGNETRIARTFSVGK